MDDIKSVCAGLVTVNDKSGIIQLVHYTTLQYFKRTQSHWFPHASTNIVYACVTYLSFTEFEGGFVQTDGQF